MLDELANAPGAVAVTETVRVKFATASFVADTAN
jgi:hypothetical protein